MKRVLAASSALGCALAAGCVYPECETVGHELVRGSFFDDFPVTEGLEYCDPDGGPCVGADGRVVFLSNPWSTATPAHVDLHGAATGWWNGVLYFVVGDEGTVMIDRPHRTWTTADIDTEADLFAVSTKFSEPLVVAVGDGVAVWSDDGGDHWQVVALPDVLFTHLLRQSDDRLLAGTSDGRLFVTTDGATWTEQPSPTIHPITAMYVARGVPLLADASGNVYELEGDDIWYQRTLPGVTSPVVSFAGNRMVWALREDGTLASRFEDGRWKQADYRASDGAVLAAGEYTGWYTDVYGYDETTWGQSMCVIDVDGQIHSNESWLEPIRDCVL